MKRPLFRALAAIFAFLFLYLPVENAWGQAPNWQWALSPGYGEAASVAVGTGGSSVVCGTFRNRATFGAISLTSPNFEDMFVAKLSSSGAYEWAVNTGNMNGVKGYAVATDPTGNVYVAGEFSDTVHFGSSVLICNGFSDVFIAKLSPAGVWQWAVRGGGSSFDGGNGLVVDSRGDVYVTGWFFSPTVSFGSTTCMNQGTSTDLFVAKLSAAGVWQWAVSAGGTMEDDLRQGPAIDSHGNILVAGTFTSLTSTFGATTLNHEPNTVGFGDVFVAKVNPSGIWQWATQVGGYGVDHGFGIGADSLGNAYLMGEFTGDTLTIGATKLVNDGIASGNHAVFVAKLNPAGSWEWAVDIDSASCYYGRGIAVDGGGNTYLTGQFFTPTIRVGGTVLTNNGLGSGHDCFVAKLNPAGVWQWAVSAGGPGNDFSQGIAADGQGGVWVVGRYNGGTSIFGATTLSQPMFRDAIFLARLGATGVGLPPEVSDVTGLMLAPNPARGTTRVMGAAGVRVTLVDLLGRIIRDVPAGFDVVTLELGELTAGLYVVRAGGQTRRLVVE